jgi:predicted RNA-binding Zn ribbon-like protein
LTGDNLSLARACVTCQGGDVRFEMVTGRPALDLVATVAERHTTHLEHLRTGEDLADWVEQAALLDDRPAVGASDLDRARTLREAVFGLVSALINGTAPDPKDVAVVNAAAARPAPTPQLTAAGEVRRIGDVGAALAVVARDCLELFSGPDRDALRWCADPECTRPFLDRSRGHRRRWCGMRGCGDRAKAAAYRQRRRAAR